MATPKPSILNMIYKDTIALDVQAENWMEAVHAAGELMVKTGSVEPRYVDAMVETVRSMGPYIVIVPGVALPHARPEDGAIRPSMSLVVLKSPVPFGNAQNDPVHLVFAFATTDNEAHLSALTGLAKILGEPETLNQIRQAGTAEEVIDILARQAVK